MTFAGDWGGQLLATAIHAGHDLRPEVAEAMVLDEATRLREEDPHTDTIGALTPARVVVHRSRFEMDLNRLLEDAVYRTPEDCWGLEVWRTDLRIRSSRAGSSRYAAMMFCPPENL